MGRADDDLAGIELKVRRIRAGIRQYRVAQTLGIPPSTLCDYENGRMPVPRERARAIIAAIQRLGGETPEADDGTSA